MNMKRILTFLLAAALALPCLISCGETSPEDEYANWKERNISFIEGIAAKCDGFQGVTSENAQPGQMFRLLSFQLDGTKDGRWTSQDYVYCEVIGKGTGTGSPLYSDSVKISYRTRLIPSTNYPEGRVIDQSYKTEDFDPSVNMPSSFALSGLIDGVVTALMYMHEGDIWRLYIPYSLAYGNEDKSSVPAYSALVFDINYVCSSRKGTNLPY